MLVRDIWRLSGHVSLRSWYKSITLLPPGRADSDLVTAALHERMCQVEIDSDAIGSRASLMAEHHVACLRLRALGHAFWLFSCILDSRKMLLGKKRLGGGGLRLALYQLGRVLWLQLPGWLMGLAISISV